MKRWRPISLCSSVSFDAPRLELFLNEKVETNIIMQLCEFRCSSFGAFFK